MDPALWQLLRAEAGTDGDRELEAVIRLATPGIEIPGVRMVARFGPVATCRIRARDVIGVRARSDVISVKAARGVSPGFDPGAAVPDPDDPAVTGIEPTDVRRGPELGPDGTGVVVAAVDWGVDVDAAVFRRPDGATRFLAFWDQRDQATGARPQPYGYGAVHRRDDIDRALRDPRPYERLGYHPAIADPRGQGTHGTRTLDIAAGNGRSGGPVGIAPQADLLFVHLADRNTGGLGNFGDSVRLLEAVDFISRTAGSQPCAINISAGRVCGPKDGTTLVEHALDELLASTPGRFVVNSAGNYYRWRTHSRGVIGPGETWPLTFVSGPADVTINELEIWYDGNDEFAVRVEPPGYSAGPPVRLGERADLLAGGRMAGRIYHRKHDPNNGGNHIVAYLDPIGLAGTWTVTLEGRQVSNGRFDAWIERDDSCPGCQARFSPGTSSTAITIGSIASSHLPLVVGAVDGHDLDRPPAPFSSAGPSRDDRGKPDLVAPGVRILAARSAPAGAQHNPGLLVRGNGTSFATPHVTGALGLCLEVAGSRLSAAEIRALVLGSCDPAPAPDLRDRLGHGYLNIPRLVASVQQSVDAADGPPHAKEPAMVPEDTLQLLADNPALAYREYLYRPRGQLGRWVSDWFEPLAAPGQSPGGPPRAGDVLLEVVLGRLGPGRCAVLAPGDVEPLAAQRRLAPGQLLLRPRPRTEITVPQPTEPPADGDLGWFSPPGDASPADEAEYGPEAEYDPGEAGDEAGPPVPVDAAAAVPPDTPAERAAVSQPLLSPQASARAVAWNARMHPGASGVTPDQIRAALDSYVDPAAVRTALDGDSAAASQPDALLAECVHQFQRKCYREQLEHDGRAGKSTLDSLGLIERGGPAFTSGLRHNARAQHRLNQHDAQVQAATGGQFSAASWFSGMTDPAVFGLRTKGGHGLHVLLVRKLRQAERYLLTLPRFHGMTPVALAAALGLSERHGGMRAAQTDSMHTFGLAIDIEYTANPWPHADASWQAMKRAATLVSGVSLHHDSAPAYFSSLGSNPALSTGQIWDELHQRHAELAGYFRLGQDPAALKAALLAGQARGTASLTQAGESVDEAVTRWQSQIAADRHALAAPGGDFTGRDPAHGFLTHDRDLVIALRDHGCLAWGAVDQGPNRRGSGDMMHFDARIDGAGRVLAWPPAGPAAGSPINFLPAPGHHPCLPAPASPAPAEAADAADDPAADYLDGKLWTFTATTLPLPVAVFCPPAALSQGQVDVLLYVHGLLDPCQPKPEHHPSEFVTDHPFAFGRIVQQAARPLVLVVPLLNWAHPGGAEVFGAGHAHWHALAAPQHINRLIGEVQAELGRVQGISPPSVGELIIAGHSRAYDFLEPLAHRRRDPAMHDDALARLSQVWAFDTTYAGEVAGWLDWLELHPRLQVRLFYRPGSATAYIGDEFYRRRGPRLAVTQVSERHCRIPAARLPALLQHGGGAVTEQAADQAADQAKQVETEDTPAAADPLATVRRTIQALASGGGAADVLAGLSALGPVELCGLGEDAALVGALASKLSGADRAVASGQLARGRISAMSRADIARITAAPAAHRFGVVAGAYGHDVLLAHHEAYDRTGTGTVHGNQSGAPAPPGTVSTDCTEYVLAVLDQAFAAAGLSAQWRGIRRRAARNSGSGGLKGTEVIRAIQADSNWQALFWAPDPRNPADGTAEHPYAYRLVNTRHAYYGIQVDPARSVVNYRRTSPARQADLSGVEHLRRLPFGLLAARGGIHMALIVNSEVHEVHWTDPATSRDAITATPLENFAWQSGVIAAPPGDLDLAWSTP